MSALRIGRFRVAVHVHRCGTFTVLHVNLNGREMVARWEGLLR